VSFPNTHDSRKLNTLIKSKLTHSFPFPLLFFSLLPAAIKDLVKEANFDFNEDGVVSISLCPIAIPHLPPFHSSPSLFPSSLCSPLSSSLPLFDSDSQTVQSMDGSHVALASIELRQEAFDRYRCDRPMSVGINIESLGKIVKQAGNDDVITLSKSDDADNLEIRFESKSE